MKMESGNRGRTRIVGSVGAGSTWESRVKHEQVRGGNHRQVQEMRVAKGRSDHGHKPEIADKSVSKPDPSDTECKIDECTSDCGSADSLDNHCIRTSSSGKQIRDASTSPSMRLQKTKSEPPIDKMNTNNSTLIRKMKSEPTTAVVASLPGKKACDPCSSSSSEEEEVLVVANCTRGSESSTQPQANGSSSPTIMKSAEFNPLGIIQSGVQETSPNPAHDPDFSAVEDELDNKVKVGGGTHHGSEIEVGNSIGENKNNEIKITSAVTSHRSKPQLIKRPSSIMASNGARKSFPTPKKPIPTPSEPSNWKESTQQSSDPESDGRFESVVDLVMWRDKSRSAFVFGTGSFIIISSSYAKDLNISVLSGASYVGLVYLAITFLYRSIMCRGMIDEGDSKVAIVGEDEAVWMVKLILPSINQLLYKMNRLFSGDPALTIKMALILFVLARCGSSITIWKVIELGFFGVFIIPKLYSSYSTHIIAYAKFWVQRVHDAWVSCSHKKIVAFAILTLLWNCCSVVARAWAAFMLYVAMRYYQQSLSNACNGAQVEDEKQEVQH